MRPSELAKYFFRIVFITSLFCGLQLSAYAVEQTENSATSKQQPLKVGIDPKLPPYTYVDKNGVTTGFDVELVRAILDTHQLEYEIHPALWHESIIKLRDAEIDLHPSVMRTKARDKDFDFTVSVGWFHVMLFIRSGSSIESLADLNNGEVLVERDTIWETWIVENAPHVKRTQFDSSEEVLKKLSAGEGDAAVVMLDNGLYFKRKFDLKNINSIGKPLFEFNSRVALPKGHESLLTILNDGIINMRRDGSYDALYDKWFGALRPDPWISKSGIKFVGASATVLVAFLTMLAIWSWVLKRRISEKTKIVEHSIDKLKLAQTVIDTIHDMVWVKDTKNNHITVNKSAAKSVGKTVEELQDSSVYEDFPDEAESYYQDDLIVIKSKKPKLGIIEQISAKDKKLWISTDKYPIFDDDNAVTGILVVVTDITKQREVQNALDKSESQMKLAQTVIDTIHEMVWIKDTNNNHITVNKSAAESVGFTIEELKGTNMMEHFPDEAEGFYQDDLEVIETKKPKLGIIERISAKDEKLWISTDKYPIFDDANTVTGILVIVTDITKQTETQNVLETREHVLSESEQLAQIGSWEHDIVNNLVYFSRGTSKIVDIATEKSVLPYDESFIVVHPDDRERVFYEYNQSIKNRTQYNITHRLRLRDGSIRYVNQRCKTYYDEAGAPIRSVGVVRDITELKELELKALQSQEHLAHSDRLNTMGQLSSSIAHEVNQPLSSISQFCSSAKLRIEKAAINDDSLLGYLDNAIEQAQRAGEIIRRLRNLVSKQLPHMTTVNINYLIRESIAFLQNTLQENQVSIKMELDGDMPMILLDGVQIQQVIINLIRNSIEAMQSTSNTQHEIEVETMNDDDEYIQIVVQDNGPGVSDDMVDIFFDAYVTSREDGLGLGLSICKTIIEVHEGRIWLDRDYSDGAKIIILLKKVTSK